MAENQNVEYKESWRDEYLKWICGFANAQGGRIYIGIDDKGNVVGINNYKKLLEDIPNRSKDLLNIIPEVNHHTKDGKNYLEIVVTPSSYPISYHGEYHYRSGSTKQTLTGTALSEFIMRKTGIRWEDAIVETVSVEDLDEESFKIFRREALRSKRMTKEELNISNEELLNKLHLTTDGQLTRAAVLLFYHDPQIVQVGSCVQIGLFEDGGELLYQDVFDESMLIAADKAADLIFTKYLKAKITYEPDVRVETYPYARDAIREAIFNAIAHNCYMFGSPIQIRINPDEMIISNQCILPEGWTAETFMQVHESRPYNPVMANVFYLAGYIERWGRGIEKICKACDELGAERPTYTLVGTGLRVHFKALKSALIEPPKASKVHNDPIDEPLENLLENRIIQEIKNNPKITYDELSKALKVSRSTVKRTMMKLIQEVRVERIGGKRYGHWQVSE